MQKPKHVATRLPALKAPPRPLQVCLHYALGSQCKVDCCALPPSPPGSPAPSASGGPFSPSAPSFELPPDLKTYSGPPEDRKAIMAYKKQRDAKLEELKRLR